MTDTGRVRSLFRREPKPHRHRWQEEWCGAFIGRRRCFCGRVEDRHGVRNDTLSTDTQEANHA
jgi:hypothetical protein